VGALALRLIDTWNVAQPSDLSVGSAVGPGFWPVPTSSAPGVDGLTYGQVEHAPDQEVEALSTASRDLLNSVITARIADAAFDSFETEE
jgi:hypothetical protein